MYNERANTESNQLGYVSMDHSLAKKAAVNIIMASIKLSKCQRVLLLNIDKQ